MRCIVTGGAGFVGSHLCDRLIEDGHDVVAIDDLSLGRLNNIDHIVTHPRFTFHELNILDAPALMKLMCTRRFDVAFHLAANSDIASGVADPTVDLNRTFLTTFNIAQAAHACKTEQIVFTSSSAIYGEVNNAISENTGPALPESFYGAAKLASEAFLSAFAKTTQIRVWLLRFPNVVGERATHGVIYDFIRKLRNNPETLNVLGNGRQRKPYIYVRDLVDALIYTWENSHDAVNDFNLGVESQTVVSDIAHMVIDEMKLDAEVRYTDSHKGWLGDVPQYSYDLRKLHSLGWRCPRSSDDAVKMAIRCILEHDKL